MSKELNVKQIMEHIALPTGFRKPVVQGDVDGNAFAIIGATTRTLKRAGHADIAQRVSEIITSADSYHTLLAACASCVSFSLDNDDDSYGDDESESYDDEDDSE
jgi:hypothetical protein